jgi:hypothetical protein
MSGQGYEELIVLNRKLDELIDRHNHLKLRMDELNDENKILRTVLQDKEMELKELRVKYERIKLSGALLGEGENANEAKKTITELVREIDRCVALLNR